MADEPDLGALSPGARQLVETVRGRGAAATHGVNDWLAALLERYGPMAEDLADGVLASALRRHLVEQIQRGNSGQPLAADDLLRSARERAAAAGRSEARERDLAAVILLAAGFKLREPAARASTTGTGAPATAASAATATGASAATAGDAPTVSGYVPRARRPTPVLDQFGRDLTRDALDGKLSALVGRTLEIELMIETLCRRTKRNPALVGPAGVGKTAIVEGLAQRVVAGNVPAPLRNVRILCLQPSNLLAGASLAGEKENRMKAVVQEASTDGIILFIDEVHSVVGAGGMPGSTDIASLLKPSLARGDMACIGATTDDEYRRFIEPDAAMERRFQPIRVQELTAEQTLAILDKLSEEFARTRGVTVATPVLHWLLDFATRYLRNRHFPDKAVDLLEQCVAHAVAGGKASVDRADATAVAERMIGRPMPADGGYNALLAALAAQTLLSPEDSLALANRLSVTARGLDVRPERPNAVVLLIGPAAGQRDALARTLASTLLGNPDRIVDIDFARFVTQWDVSALIGSAPGYVGYSDSLPIHRLLQMPWCVLCCDNVHLSHPTARDVLAQALAAGVITDGSGRRIYLSDAIVLITAGGGDAAPARGVVGFKSGDATAEPAVTGDAARAQAEDVLGAEFVALVDLVCADVVPASTVRARWVEDHLLKDLAERFRRQGLELTWEPGVVPWLLQRTGQGAQRNVERMIDEQVSALLVRHLPAVTETATRAVVLRCDGERLTADAVTPPAGA